MTPKLTKEEAHEVLLLLLSEEGRLARLASKYRESGRDVVAGMVQKNCDHVMAIRKKFQPKERD